jgi:pSer/pThr/pTyr-binding forkhead associated (FHA) protein
MYRLLFPDRVMPKEPVVVDLPSLVIGRRAECHVQLAEPGVSDRHAIIERHADGYYVRGLDSSNRIRVNGVAMTRHRLASGDDLEIGPVHLRFEIVHGTGARRQRRPIDLLLVLATAIVVAVIGGEIALLSSMFSENRPKKVKLDTTRSTQVDQPGAVPSSVSAPAAPASSAPHPQADVARPAPTAAEPTVLKRMIRIARVDPSKTGDSVSITIQAKAQVGERELDTLAVAICVQFAAVAGTGPGTNWRKPMWLSIPAWENFTSKAFTVKFPGSAREYAGYVVRTYYHKQMQDIAAVPPSLRPLAPDPSTGGAL